jgi:hypothetical protein
MNSVTGKLERGVNGTVTGQNYNFYITINLWLPNNRAKMEKSYFSIITEKWLVL